MIDRTLPFIVLPIDPPVSDGVAENRRTLHTHKTIALKDIVTDAERSGARVFQYPDVLNRKDTDSTIPQEGISIPTIRIVRPIDGSSWLLIGHLIGGVTADRMSRTRSDQNYSFKTDF